MFLDDFFAIFGENNRLNHHILQKKVLLKVT